MLCFFFVMIRRPPRFTRTDTRVPYTTLFRSAFGRRDMVLAAGLNVGRCLHLADVDRGAVHRDTARQDEAVLEVEVAQISLVPFGGEVGRVRIPVRSEEHTSELQSLMRISYAVFCLKKKTTKKDELRLT